MRARRFAVAAAGLVSAGALAVLALQGPPDDREVPTGAPQDIAEDILNQAAACLSSDTSALEEGAESCVIDPLQQAALLYGLGTARAAMDLVAADSRVGGCHFMAHALGHAAVSRYPLSEVAQYGFLHCDTGFYDGATMAIGDLYPDADEQTLVRHVNTLCEGDGTVPVPTSAVCVHGLGHLLVERYDRNFDASLRACDAVPDLAVWPEGPDARAFSWRASCVSGVIMEFRNNPTEAIPAARYPTELCRGLRSTSLDQCLNFTGIADIVQRDGNSREYLAWCLDQRELASSTECFSNVTLWGFFTQDTGPAFETCTGLARNKEDRVACAFGYAVGPYRSGLQWNPENSIEQGCQEFPQYCDDFQAISPALRARFDGSDDFRQGRTGV